jgi:hypothetical protein
MRRLAPTGLLAALLLGGCGALQANPGADASASRTATPTGTPVASWQSFSSPKLGYSIPLPPDLHYQGSTGGPYSSDYFSNENVGSPEQMDQSGIFFTIVLTTDSGAQCFQHGLNGSTIARDDNVVVDGTSATLHVASARGASMMISNLFHGNYCYQFDFVSWSQQVRDAREGDAQSMMASFRFGTAPQSLQ